MGERVCANVILDGSAKAVAVIVEGARKGGAGLGLALGI